MKELIIETLKTVNRDGIGDLINWLENDTDFFTAPASTRFHGAYKGGLAIHSMNVYMCMEQILTMPYMGKHYKDSVIICALLHDLCKTGFYKETTRNVKNETTGQWEKQPYYTVEDTHPYGHGECSVMLIEKFIKLTDEERYSIRWHMGGFDESVKGGSYAIGHAFEKYPLALALHMADMMATFILEKQQ